jgi:hypothetical protein
MAIATYADLQAAVANWLDRENLTTYIPDFITLYEAKFNRTMELRQMETTATLTAASSAYALPTGIARIREVWNAGVNPIEPLSPVTPDYANHVSPQTGSSPAHYYISGSSLYTIPYDGANIGIRYFAKLTAMSADADANWLLTAYPDAYLYGSLVEAFMFEMDEARAQMWQARLDLVHDEIKRQDAGMRWANASVRVTGPTP